jgi:hypothetical protein
MFGWIKRWKENRETEIESAKSLFAAAATSIAKGEMTEEQAKDILYTQLHWVPIEIRRQVISNSLKEWSSEARSHHSIIDAITAFLNESARAQSPEEQESVRSTALDLANRYPEAFKCAYEAWEDRWATDYAKALEGRKINLSNATLQIRSQMGWPSTGALRTLPGAPADIATAVEFVDAHGGEVLLKDAILILAALDPEGPEARFLAYRKRKNLPPL